MRVGVISDTHGKLRPEALAALSGVEHIIHAGDVGKREVMYGLRDIAPLTVVRGNVDRDGWCEMLSHHETVELGGARVHVLHIRGELDGDPRALGYDVVIFGHSHKPLIERDGAVLYLNPGSAGPRRFSLPVTVALLDLPPSGEPRAEIVELL